MQKSLQESNFIKESLQRRYFTLKFAKFEEF